MKLSRFLRFFVIAFLVLLALITLLVIGYWMSAKSNYSGTVISAGLAQAVNIQFDENDVPHIKAKSQRDAFYALGFVHATERSWQLEISRRLASGRLSEILGERTVSLDRFIRTLGIKQQPRNSSNAIHQKSSNWSKPMPMVLMLAISH